MVHVSVSFMVIRMILYGLGIILGQCMQQQHQMQYTPSHTARQTINSQWRVLAYHTVQSTAMMQPAVPVAVLPDSDNSGPGRKEAAGRREILNQMHVHFNDARLLRQQSECCLVSRGQSGA